MTTIALTPDQLAAAESVAKEIGGAVERAREAVGHSKKSLARELGMYETTVGRIERGVEPNLKLGSVMRVLNHYGLTLVVVPRGVNPRSDRISDLADRILAAPGGEDLLRRHLKKRGLELVHPSEL